MKNLDIQAILAVSWLLVAIGISIVFGPYLGARGWLWLGIHHVLCIIGCGHEYFRYQRRIQQAKTAMNSKASLKK